MSEVKRTDFIELKVKHDYELDKSVEGDGIETFLKKDVGGRVINSRGGVCIRIKGTKEYLTTVETLESFEMKLFAEEVKTNE